MTKKDIDTDTINNILITKHEIKIVSTSAKSQSIGLRPRAVFRQVFMVVLANLSIMTSGLALALPAVTVQQLADPNEGVFLSASQLSWFASVCAFSAPLGGTIAGVMLDKIGRKNSLFLVNFLSIISWGGMALATQNDNKSFFIQLMVARIVVGITIGCGSSPVGVYAAEIAHQNIRGRLTLGTSISVATGIVVMYTLGYFIRDDWRLICSIVCGYSICAALITFIIPESPSWLLAKGRDEEARKSLRYFRGFKKNDIYTCEEFEQEYSRLAKSARLPDGVKKASILKELKEPEVYKPILIMVGFFFFQQFSGIFVVIVYAVQFSIEAGVTIDPILCAIFIGLARLLTTIAMGPLLDKWGRRPPAFISGLGMTICMFLLAASVWFPSISNKYMPVILILTYIVTSTLGLMTLPFAMISEVFPQRVRGAASGATIAFGLLCSFLALKFYPAMVTTFNKENVFAFYGIVSLVAVLYLYIYLPETKGKTLVEIENYFRYGKQSKLDHPKEIEMNEVFIQNKS